MTSVRSLREEGRGAKKRTDADFNRMGEHCNLKKKISNPRAGLFISIGKVGTRSKLGRNPWGLGGKMAVNFCGDQRTGKRKSTLRGQHKESPKVQHEKRDFEMIKEVIVGTSKTMENPCGGSWGEKTGGEKHK